MRPKNSQVELILTVACITAERGETLSTHEIAELCGCSQRYIAQTIKKALAKLRLTRLAEFK